MQPGNILVFTSCLMVGALVHAETKNEVRSYDYGRAEIKEYRERGNITRIVVNPEIGPRYTLEEKNKMPTMSDQDYVGQNTNLPTIELKRW